MCGGQGAYQVYHAGGELYPAIGGAMDTWMRRKANTAVRAAGRVSVGMADANQGRLNS